MHIELEVQAGLYYLPVVYIRPTAHCHYTSCLGSSHKAQVQLPACWFSIVDPHSHRGHHHLSLHSLYLSGTRYCLQTCSLAAICVTGNVSVLWLLVSVDKSKACSDDTTPPVVAKVLGLGAFEQSRLAHQMAPPHLPVSSVLMHS